ncbi:MAG: hypothetical protein NC390_06995 [Fusobacterium sp.]|nr:hypothetical protein [Fusobacterium sp.]
MAVVCSDSVNSHMKNPKWSVGVLNVPNSHPNVVLYSPRQAEHDFRQMDMDIYQNSSKYSYLDNKKTPKSLWVFLGLGGSFGIYKLIKCLMKK